LDHERALASEVLA